MSDDTTKLAELSRNLGAIDVDATSADRIAHRARADLGRGPSRLRFGEPVLVAIFTLSLLAWALIKVLEVLG
jgi:hypothetical protein